MIRRLALQLAAILVVCLFSYAAFASHTGIGSGNWADQPNKGCRVCHKAQAPDPVVTLVGNTNVQGGSTHCYTLIITPAAGDTRVGGGFNVSPLAGMSDQNGTLKVVPTGELCDPAAAPGADNPLGADGARVTTVNDLPFNSNTEMTHSAVKQLSGSDIRFHFRWTAPPSCTGCGFVGWGNLVNQATGFSGDAPAKASDFKITVQPSTLPNGSVCTGGSTCTSGNCVSNHCCAQPSCPGSVTACSAAPTCDTGSCKSAPINDGGACTSSNLCVSGGHCSGGQCTGPTKSCGSGNGPCVGTCDPNSGLCTSNGQSCSDGNACTEGDTCQDGECRFTSTISCRNSTDPCLSQSNMCDPTLGCNNNTPAPTGAACNDGNPLTKGDFCDGSGHCQAGQPPVSDLFTWGTGLTGNDPDLPSASPIRLSLGVTFISVSMSSTHTLALANDHSVWAWGDNTKGELGTGNDTSSRVPIRLARPLDNTMIAVAAGKGHSLALSSDGTLYAWGDNTNGQLGTGDRNGSLLPVKIASIHSVKAIAAGDAMSIALVGDGVAWAWGRQVVGDDLLLPTFAWGTVTQIAAGGGTGYALGEDGTVFSWGHGELGQIGNGQNQNVRQGVPVQVPGLNGVRRIAAGDRHALAIMSDGNVKTWGANEFGQLGRKTTLDFDATPADTKTIDGDVIEAAGGISHSAVLTATGAVFTFGNEGLTAPKKKDCKPKQIAGAANIQHVAAGGDRSSALEATGVAYAFGANDRGQIGNEIGANNALLPVLVTNLPSVVKTLSSRCDHNLALLADGTIWAWGANSEGQIGNDLFDDARTATPALSKKAGFVAVEAGCRHSIGLLADGTVWTWGVNDHGQLGKGDSNKSTPVKIPTLSGVVAIGSGDDHSFAITADGQLFGWGLNQFGQVGDGTVNDVLTPVLVSGHIGHVVQVTGGLEHTYALRSDGLVFSWGNNTRGQLGDGSFNPHEIPLWTGWRQSPDFFNDWLRFVTAISSGARHGIAIRDGYFSSWGDNTFLQTGRLRTDRFPQPFILSVDDVGSLSGNITISLGAGANHSLFTWEEGILITCGSEADGELGHPQTVGAFCSGVRFESPVALADGGSRHSVALVP